GSSIDWEISDWNGAAGTGFDQILCASWNATATPAAKAIIRISGSTLTNFTESGKSFVLANTATTVTDFDPAAFEIDATGFTAGLGTWSIAASGTDVLLVYTRFNTTPELGAAPASFTATEDQPFAASISATDPDLNETLSYIKSSGPDWVSVSPSGVISGTPGNADVGNQSLTIAVTDSFNATNSRSINLLVENVNDAPVFSTNPISATSATEDASYAYDISSFASDPDAAELLVFSKISGPTWLDLSAGGNLTGTPLNEHVGPHSIVVRVTDAGGLWVETTVNLEVINKPNPDANSNGIDDAWEIVKFGNANENAHPATGDEDGDGLSNILEFALDTHPAIGNPSPLTSSFVESEDGLVLELTIPKNPLAENLVYTVEATNDLAQGPWSSATTVVVSDTPTQRIVRDTQARSSNTSRFLRLKVTTVP
ncbi:MAG: putative Ig domain-containing protein, partial [Akkermansiaceae bacterium]|nr:putative Ig domain-containing protein [Akkermansiaceae bacterium]